MTDPIAPLPAPAGLPAANSAARQTSTTAVISLISGILGWTALPWIGSIVAIITGHMARAEIRRNPETMEGDGLAIGGLVLGWAMVALSILGLMLVILLFGGIAAVIGWLGMTGQLN